MSTNRCVLLLSGPLSVGKTAVRAVLVSSHGFSNLRSSEYLRSVAKIRGLSTDRRILQEIGDGLDMSTDYRWLIDDVAYPVMEDNPSQGLWIVDAVRKLRQIEHFRNRFGATVHHIHFTASEEVLRARYYVRQKAQGSDADLTPYEVAIDHDNERAARSLAKSADLLINLGVTSPLDAAGTILRTLTGGCSP